MRERSALAISGAVMVVVDLALLALAFVLLGSEVRRVQEGG